MCSQEGIVDEKRLPAVLVDFARTLTSDFSIQTILDHLVDHVVEVIPVDGAGVLLMDCDMNIISSRPPTI